MLYLRPEKVGIGPGRRCVRRLSIRVAAWKPIVPDRDERKNGNCTAPDELGEHSTNDTRSRMGVNRSGSFEAKKGAQ